MKLDILFTVEIRRRNDFGAHEHCAVRAVETRALKLRMLSLVNPVEVAETRVDREYTRLVQLWGHYGEMELGARVVGNANMVVGRIRVRVVEQIASPVEREAHERAGGWV